MGAEKGIFRLPVLIPEPIKWWTGDRKNSGGGAKTGFGPFLWKNPEASQPSACRGWPLKFF